MRLPDPAFDALVIASLALIIGTPILLAFQLSGVFR